MLSWQIGSRQNIIKAKCCPGKTLLGKFVPGDSVLWGTCTTQNVTSVSNVIDNSLSGNYVQLRKIVFIS